MEADQNPLHFQRSTLYSTLQRWAVPHSRRSAPERARVPERLRRDVGLPPEEFRHDWQTYL